MDEEGPKAAPGGACPGRAGAIASLVLGLLAAGASSSLTWFDEPQGLFCFGPVLAIAAVIFACRALRASKRTPRPKGNRPTAIGGLVVGSLTLAWLLFFMVGCQTRRYRYRGSCKNNLKRIGLAMHLYANDYDDWFPIGPPETDSSYALGILAYGEEPYITWADIFICPGSDDRVGAWPRAEGGYSGAGGGLRPSSTSYVYLAGMKASDHPDSMVVFDDTDRHENGRNVLFLDGHTEYLKEHEFTERLIWQIQLLLDQRLRSAD